MSFVKIIFQLVRNGRYIFPILPCLSFLNTFASALKQRRLSEQLQRAAVESSMSSVPLLCRLCPILSPSCPFQNGLLPSLPVPHLGSSFVFAVISGDFACCFLLLSFFVIKRWLVKTLLSSAKQLEEKRKVYQPIYSCCCMLCWVFWVVPFSVCCHISTI